MAMKRILRQFYWAPTVDPVLVHLYEQIEGLRVRVKGLEYQLCEARSRADKNFHEVTELRAALREAELDRAQWVRRTRDAETALRKAEQP
jgi:hypothetical protein